MAAEKAFQEETIEMIGEEEKSFLHRLQEIEGYKSTRKLLDSLNSIANPLKDTAKPVTAHQPESVKYWLSTLLDVEPSEDFFSFGALSRSELNMGIAGKETTYFGSEDEKEKYRDYCKLFRSLYFLWLRMTFPKSFDDCLFIPIAIQNISHTTDNDIRIVLTIAKGKAIYPTKELIAKELEAHRGRICHEGLIDELFAVPQIPLVEQEYSPNQIRQPKFHMGLWGNEQDTENEEDYESNLQQYILSPESDMHYSTTVSRMRASEIRLLSGGILVKPDDGEVVIDYCIHSALLTGEIRGTLSCSTD